MLKIQFKDKRHPPLWVVEKLYSIGSASDNNLIVSDEGIDPLHARLISGDDKIFLKDNNSSSGCFVNGQRITNKEIVPGDLIRLGSVEFEVLDPSAQQPGSKNGKKQSDTQWRLVSDSSWLAGQTFVVPSDRPVVIGRDVQSDIVIPGTHLSRRHAELTVMGKSLRVKDLASSNGTFINDKRVDTTIANSGDRLRLDVYTFRLVGPDVDEKNKTRVRAPIESLTKSIERKQASSEPKRWKTRPTSPGNRTEPTYAARNRKSDIWLWLILIAIVIGLIATVYLL
jgi:pSer/pThr/pTyr-binding forkhead associated (FHA) protein